jgi:predicted transcriptional regulator
MSGPSERARLETRMKDAQRRSRELEQEGSQLHDRLVETAESVRRSHEQTAETMQNLADTGAAEHVARRREAAERSRRFAEEEARQLAELAGRDVRERDPGGDTADRPARDLS